jgi:transcriptional regulator with XRE-family HTH domain
MSEAVREAWGRNIIARRDELGITQRGLAELVGVSVPSVCRWETGKSAPKDEHKALVAKALELDARFLFPLVAA